MLAATMETALRASTKSRASTSSHGLDELRRYDLERDVARPGARSSGGAGGARLPRAHRRHLGDRRSLSALLGALGRRRARSAARSPTGVDLREHDRRSPSRCSVLDELAQSRYADLPVVEGGSGSRFYAGAPLVTPSGYVLGTMCVVDRQPRTLDPGEARGSRWCAIRSWSCSRARRELGELRRSEALRQEAVEALVATQARSVAAHRAAHARGRRRAPPADAQMLERIADGYIVLDRDVALRLRQPARGGRSSAHAGSSSSASTSGASFPRASASLPRRLRARDARAGRGHASPITTPVGSLVREPHLSLARRRRRSSSREIDRSSGGPSGAEETASRLVEAQRGGARRQLGVVDPAPTRVTWSEEMYPHLRRAAGGVDGSYEGSSRACTPTTSSRPRAIDRRRARARPGTSSTTIASCAPTARCACCTRAARPSSPTASVRAGRLLLGRHRAGRGHARARRDGGAPRRRRCKCRRSGRGRRRAGNGSAHNAQAKAFVPLPAALVDSARRLGARTTSATRR